MIYLGAPYSHKNPEVMLERYYKITEYTADLMKKGYAVFSPITYGKPIADLHDLPHTYEFWLSFDLKMLEACSEFWVLQLDGWEESKGLKAEIEFAKENKITTFYTPPSWRAKEL